jgi:hypothetical protein
VSQVDTPAKSCQHRGPHSTMVAMPQTLIMTRTQPTYRPERLLVKRSAHSVGLDMASMLLMTESAGPRKQSPRAFPEPFSGRLHRGMNGADTGKGKARLARWPEHFAGFLDRRLAARNTVCAGSKFAASTTSSVLAPKLRTASRSLRSRIASSEDSCHGASAHRHRVLHRLRAKRTSNAAWARSARRKQRVPSTAGRMTGHHGRRRAALGTPRPVGRDSCHQHDRLGIVSRPSTSLGPS